MKTRIFNRQKRHFRHLAKHINHLITSGEWARLSGITRNRLIARLNGLYRQVRFYFSHLELKKVLAAAAVFIGLPLVSHAQSFAPPVQNPFGLIADTTYIASPAFADIDNDGDQDLFSGNWEEFSYKVQFFENTGTPGTPQFAAAQDNPFGITLPGVYLGFPVLADIDQDGDLDLFLGGAVAQDEGGVQFFENTGTPTAVANPFGLSNTYGFAIPEFADIDNDGDLDMFAGEGYGNFQFFENTGTPSAPDFAAPVQNPFGIIAVYYIGTPRFADIDHDGDLDLFVGEYYGNFIYFQNTGNAESPAFDNPVTNPFGLVPTYYYNFPAFADLDNDGDMDILSGEYYGMFQYFKNTEFNIGLTEIDGKDFFNLYPNPSSEWVNIALKNNTPAHPVELTIVDLEGKVIKRASLKTKDLRLTTNDLPPGVYFVRIIDKEKVYTQKLIIR
jgi:hypothetical protein